MVAEGASLLPSRENARLSHEFRAIGVAKQHIAWLEPLSCGLGNIRGNSPHQRGVYPAGRADIVHAQMRDAVSNILDPACEAGLDVTANR
jgi:hypothetical protein